VTEVRDRALAEFGTVDVLVNNAGQGLHLPLAEVD
jgi:short-subunit dehydrogenase